MKKLLLSTIAASTLLFAQNQPYDIAITLGGTVAGSKPCDLTKSF